MNAFYSEKISIIKQYSNTIIVLSCFYYYLSFVLVKLEEGFHKI